MEIIKNFKRSRLNGITRGNKKNKTFSESK